MRSENEERARRFLDSASESLAELFGEFETNSEGRRSDRLFLLLPLSPLRDS